MRVSFSRDWRSDSEIWGEMLNLYLSGHSPHLSAPGEIVRLVDESIQNDLWITQDLSGEYKQLQIEFGAIMASLGPTPS